MASTKRAKKPSSRPRRPRPDGPIVVGLVRFAELCGVHRNTITNWLDEGLPHTRARGGGSIDVAVGFTWVRARDRREFEEELAELRDDRNGDKAKAAKAVADARLREMDLLERSGRLLVAEDVEARWTQIVVAVREGVLAIPGLAVQQGIIPPAEEAALDDICRDALTALGRRATSPPTDTEPARG